LEESTKKAMLKFTIRPLCIAISYVYFFAFHSVNFVPHNQYGNIATDLTYELRIGLCSVLRPRQHSIGYMGDGFYRSKNPTNSIKVLKEKAVKENNTKNTKKTQNTHMHTHTK